MRASLCVTLASLSCAPLLVGPAWAAAYRLDPARSSLVVQVFRDGPAAKLGHDHLVQATTFSGRIIYDPAAPEASSITVQVHTATLRVDDPATRRKFQLTGEPNADDVARIEKSMKAESQLDTARFPVITFTSTTVTAEAPGRYLVAGQLAIRGVTNAVRCPVTVRMEGERVRGIATLTVSQRAFGYEPYSALFGAIKNKDAVVLHIDLVAGPE